MKILMLTPYLPYPLTSGGQIRTYNLLKNLSKKHQITLFSLIKNQEDEKYINQLKPFVAKIKLFKRSTKPFTLKNILRTAFSFHPFVVTRNLVSSTKEAVEKELSTDKYDLIHAETFYMMPNIPKTNIPTILVEQTIEYLGYQSYAKASKLLPIKPFLAIDIFKIMYWEQYYWKKSNRLITMSDNDKNFIQSKLPQIKNINVVANGIDIEFFNQVKKQLPSNPTILFVGTFSWLPNIQAVTYLVEEVFPLIKKALPNTKLHIVGFSPTKKVRSFGNSPDITVSGSVEDIRTAYATAHVSVSPVKWGKGTRYKILEAMVTKTPIISTPIAVEGINGIKNNQHVLLGESAQELAQQTIKILKNPKLHQRLAKNAYELVTSRYNWESISEELDHIYQELGSMKS